MAGVRIRRVYEPPEEADGVRILVDRLWPRGVSRETAGIDHWLKEVAPSRELRTWYNHDPAKWDEFRKRYFAELDAAPDVVEELRALMGDGPSVLLYAARSPQANAAALLEYLNR